MVLDATRTISGSYGTVWMDGRWLTNFNSAEAMGELDKEEIKRSGTRTVGHKVVGITWSGTLKGLKVTSELTELISQVADDTKAPFVTELILKLADPEAYGFERVRLKGVQFDRIDLIRFEAGSVVEQELPFTFSGMEWLDKIVGV